MKNKTSVIDFIITAIFVIVSCFAIGRIFNNRVDKFGGNITMDNYQSILSEHASPVLFGSGYSNMMTYDYAVEFTPLNNYKLYNVTIEYVLESEYSNINGTYSETFSSIKDKVRKEGRVTYEYPPEIFGTNGMPLVAPDIKIRIISISGRYRYSGG